MVYWLCSRNEQSPTCEVVHETNKAHFRNLLTNRFLPSSVGKALAWRSGCPSFNPHWGQFLTNLFFALRCVKICQTIWQKRLSWKTQFSTNRKDDRLSWKLNFLPIGKMLWWFIIIQSKLIHGFPQNTWNK